MQVPEAYIAEFIGLASAVSNTSNPKAEMASTLHFSSAPMATSRSKEVLGGQVSSAGAGRELAFFTQTETESDCNLFLPSQVLY